MITARPVSCLSGATQSLLFGPFPPGEFLENVVGEIDGAASVGDATLQLGMVGSTREGIGSSDLITLSALSVGSGAAFRNMEFRLDRVVQMDRPWLLIVVSAAGISNLTGFLTCASRSTEAPTPPGKRKASHIRHVKTPKRLNARQLPNRTAKARRFSLASH